MASNSFGEIFRLTSFGESHGPALGVVVDGVPPGLPLAEADLEPDLARRRPGQSEVTTSRNEADQPRILSGVFEGRTTGTPICVMVENTNQRSADYARIAREPRPGHADRTYDLKYGHRDPRGGGRSSGRETVARVIAGSIAKKILPAELRIVGHALSIGPFRAEAFDESFIESNPVRCADAGVARQMAEHLVSLREAGDSCGGIVEVRVAGVPVGLGDPVFRKLKATLAQGVMSIGAVMGFSYGAGFGAARASGSEMSIEPGAFGGLEGGITNGDPIRIEAAIKPTSTVGRNAREGRHDPCIVPRVVPVVEAMVAICLADALLAQRALTGDASPAEGP